MIRKPSLLFTLVCIGLLSASCGNSNHLDKEAQNLNPPDSTGQNEIVSQDALAVPKEITPFLGVWSGPDHYPIVELTYKDSSINIRECYGLDAEIGTTYVGAYNAGKVIATGNENNFYKFTLPTFQLVESILLFNSGVGPVELERSKVKMPMIQYDPPYNGD